MIGRATRSGLNAALLTTLIAVAMSAGSAVAAGTAPVKQVIINHIGWDVNRTKELEGAPQAERNLCTVASKDECQPGVFSGEVGGFFRAVSVAGGPSPEDYMFVADQGNNRIDVFSSSGEFVLMFGKHVNAKTGADICTEAEILIEGAKCQAGEAGTEAGAFINPSLIAADPSTGDVYVREPENDRVDEYTPTGKFVWMVGKEVNKTKKANLCTEKEVESESVQCGAGERLPAGSSEHGAFRNPEALAAGPDDTLYVGDEHSVQEFDGEGTWVGEIRQPLEQISAAAGSTVSRLTVDAAGNVYLVYEVAFSTGTILEFDPTGKEVNEFPSPDYIIDIAADPSGRLAVVENESGELRGLLYRVEGKTIRLITAFDAANDEAVAFNGNDEMFGAARGEIVLYKPVSVGELTTGAAVCVPGAVLESNVTLNCELKGTVDQWGVPNTSVWFDWGSTPALGNETRLKPVPVLPAPTLKEGEEENPIAVAATIVAILPDEKWYDQLEGEDENVLEPEVLSSASKSFTTETVPPRIVGQPSALLIGATSADLFGEVNPENTETTYEFQYAPANACPQLESCGQMLHTEALLSNAYGKLGAMLEASNLQPATEYRYRLYAVNQNPVTGEPGELAVNETGGPQLPEGAFTTAPLPVPSVVTGVPRGVGQTTATITGSVDPNGQAATYSFELGISDGAATKYGTVYSASAGASETQVEETLNLAGLQPGTTYSYRIAVKSGYIDNETHTLQGAPQMFTTRSSESALTGPAPQVLLATPQVTFPKTPPPLPAAKKCKRGYKRNKHGKCVRVKKTAKAKKAGAKRR